MSKILRQFTARDSSDGDGIKLKKVFGFYQKEVFDPFLMLDHIDTSYPKNGFPWHPHRGIETITYMVKGKTRHEDSMGNKGVLTEGDIQWMKAGSGILHQELPDPTSEKFELLQFWLNIPAESKMTQPEYHYTNILNDNLVQINNSTVSIIAGEFNSVLGPIQKKDRNIKLLHVDLKESENFTIERVTGTNAFIYVLSGTGTLDKEEINQYTIYKLDSGNITVSANSDMKFIYAEGTPLNENIEWYGPIVMNTRSQIIEAKNELQNGTFIKHGKEL